MVSRIFFILLFQFFCGIIPAHASQDALKSFVSISNPVVRQIRKDAGADWHKLSKDERQKYNRRQIELFTQFKQQLRQFLVRYPDSPWSDDAQYLIAGLSMDFGEGSYNAQEQIAELEKLIADYPDPRMEEFTKKSFPLFVSHDDSWDLDHASRVQLFLLYKDLGMNEKLEKLINQSLEKYPQDKVFSSLKSKLLSHA